MGVVEKIKEIEAEMARTQKNKATEYHLGQLKAKLAKLRTQLLEPAKGASSEGDGFEVQKYGHGRVALLGFPSVGKSTLLSTLTGTDSEAAAYEFTTLTCIPGVIHYNDAKIQLLDLPGIIEGASEGKGRGRQVIAVAKSSDMIMMVLDASKFGIDNHKQILTKELEAVGIRLNRSPPQIYFKRKKSGGVTFNSTVNLTKVDEKMVHQILQEYKIHHCELLFREDVTVDDLIDTIEGNRRYIRCLYVYNKADVISLEEVDQLARTEDSVAVSCYMNLGLDYLLERTWDMMALTRVYTKKVGHKPDFDEPVILSQDRGGVTVESFCNHIHRDLAKTLSYSMVWGTSTKHHAQRCGLSHELEDEDVVQLVKNKKATVQEELKGRFKNYSDAPARIADRVKKAPLKS
ncbi:GTP-binding protein [Cymbomonas tetramitiformis]|uniref:GTP-binding protein n=1 Tax=Cymbomonas tetramitiformis TaxID=36881 RepID=A0AAE0F3L9_9CHLO|nr:GTP-binding protein [Cymbomonas tetramitiformis]KAK3250147.1 GTP-binding protein [Cymbomonas tetramitiformis]|eukprot:gene13172-15557_t